MVIIFDDTETLQIIPLTRSVAYSYLYGLVALNKAHTRTHTRITAFFRDYPGEPVPER